MTDKIVIPIEQLMKAGVESLNCGLCGKQIPIDVFVHHFVDEHDYRAIEGTGERSTMSMMQRARRVTTDEELKPVLRNFEEIFHRWENAFAADNLDSERLLSRLDDQLRELERKRNVTTNLDR